jgi:hypothetical protein
MGKVGKSLVLALVLVIAISSVSLLIVKPINAQSPDTQNFTYVVSNYAVNYSIVSSSVGYYLFVYQNYPPFPIEISFYDGNQKVTSIATTNSYSTSFDSTNYPEQITMKVTNAPTSAPSSPNNPTVPEFTLRYVDNSYDVPPVPATTPTYTTDPYTGKQAILNPGSSEIPSYQVENKTIELSIKNQPLSQFYFGPNTSLFYNVQVKGHYAENWTEAFSSMNYGSDLTWYNYPIQSNSDYTIISLPANYPVGGQVDFRVQAVIANQTEVLYYPYGTDPYQLGGGTSYPETVMFIVQTSDWSNTQTLSLPDGSVTISTSTNPTSSQAPTSTPMIPEFPFIAILLLLSLLSVAAVLNLKKKRITKNMQ